MKEIWKDVKGYEGKYQVSNYGRIKSLSRLNRAGVKINEKVLKPKHAPNRYVRVHLSTGEGYKWELVHRLVADAFVERKSEDHNIVNHLDNNPSNNHADNLEWTTYKGNMQWASKQGRMSGNPHNFDIAHEQSKKPVIAIDSHGNRYRFESQTEASNVLGVNSGHIAKLCRKEYGYKQSNGYSFEYADDEYQKSLKPKKTKMSEEMRSRFFRDRMMGNQLGKGKKPTSENIQKIKQLLSKPICQYDRNGNFTKEYESANSAYKTTGISHSDDVANGKRKTAGGYIWRWKEAV